MLLQTTNLTKQYTGQHSSPVEALRGVSFELAEGEFASVQGPSGCGKTTLLRILFYSKRQPAVSFFVHSNRTTPDGGCRVVL